MPRANSRPHPLPGCLFHLSVLNDYLARSFPPARRFPYQTNNSSRRSMSSSAPRSTSLTPPLCAPRIAKAQQHIKTTSHPRLAFESDVVAQRLFLCRAVALRLFSHSFSRPRVFCLSSRVARRFVAGRVLPRLVAVCVTAAARGQRSEIGREREKQAKIGYFALNRAKTRLG